MSVKDWEWSQTCQKARNVLEKYRIITFATHVTLLKGKGRHKYVLTKIVLYTKRT